MPATARVKRQIASGRAGPSQELFDLAEESGRFRVRILGREALELVQQFTLPLGQLLRSPVPMVEL